MFLIFSFKIYNLVLVRSSQNLLNGHLVGTAAVV